MVNVPILRAIVGDDGHGVAHKATVAAYFAQVVIEDGGERLPDGLCWECRVVVKDMAGRKAPPDYGKPLMFDKTFGGCFERFKAAYLDTGEYVPVAGSNARIKHVGDQLQGTVINRLTLECTRLTGHCEDGADMPPWWRD